MSLPVAVRPERPEDYEAIRDITTRAFASMAFSAGDEQDLIEALRKHGALTLSLVAVAGDKVVGHVAFSPARARDSELWYALGPVAVEPTLQAQGIGSRLINEGIGQLRSMQAAGCILVGDPNYYARFGFKPFPELAPEGEPPEYFMILPLAIVSPSSVVSFHPLFHAGQ